MRYRKRAYRAALWMLLAALVSVAMFAGLQLWRVARDSRRAARLVEEMRRAALAGEAEAEPAPASPPAPPDASLPARADGEQAHTCPFDFDALRQSYPDAVAWLVGCGGEIDTPVVQGADNQYYLGHLPDGRKNMLGAAFLDCANSAAFSDGQSFVFGHHMDTGGGVFAPLLRYQEQAYFDAHPAFTLHTPSGCFSAEVFAAFVVSEQDYPYTRAFASDDALRGFTAWARARSDVVSPAEPAPGDKLLTLCTCTSKTNDLRYVLCARLAPLA